MKNFIYLFIAVFCFQAKAQWIKDESHLDADFLQFKKELLACAIQKDKIKLKEFLAERVFESNDGCPYPGCTKDELIQYYFINNAEDSWNDLLKVIRFGFIQKLDENPDRIVPHDSLIFYGPSYTEGVDSNEEVLILGENVNIREKPGLDAKVIRTASFEKFSCDCSILTNKESTYQNRDGITWLEISLPSGQGAYVAAEFTSKRLSREITIAKIEGEWKIISFYQSLGC
ncbi:MAG: SH3 domain-containing protein [Chitinophagales bacterium]|nr:SH3 domain-containing protein [Chitinophagales bacterium]